MWIDRTCSFEKWQIYDNVREILVVRFVAFRRHVDILHTGTNIAKWLKPIGSLFTIVKGSRAWAVGHAVI